MIRRSSRFSSSAVLLLVAGATFVVVLLLLYAAALQEPSPSPPSPDPVSVRVGKPKILPPSDAVIRQIVTHPTRAPPRPRSHSVWERAEETDEPTTEQEPLTRAPPATTKEEPTPAPPTTTEDPNAQRFQPGFVLPVGSVSHSYVSRERRWEMLECVRAFRGHYWNSTSSQSCLPLFGWNESASDGGAHLSCPRKQQSTTKDIFVATNSNDDAAPLFRAFHDEKISNLYRLENVCASPSRGFLTPTSRTQKTFSVYEPFRGLEETRGVFASLQPFAEFLASAREKHQQDDAAAAPLPRVVARDGQIAVFFPLSPETRGNAGHTLLRILSLLGVLRRQREASPLSPSSPSFLLVLVDIPRNSSAPVDGSARARAGQTQHDAIGMFLDALAVPWIKVNGAVGMPSSAVEEREMCFPSAVAWQNCFNCAGRDPKTENESPYSFGIWQRVNEQRLASLQQLRQLVLGDCLGLSTPPPSTQQFLPRLLFDVRTKWRSIPQFGLFVEIISQRLEGIVELPIRFSEPFVGSTSKFFERAASSDIIVGAHGAGLAVAATFMKPGSALVEIASPFFAVSEEDSRQHNISRRAWFGGLADALDLDHSLVLLSRGDSLNWNVAKVPAQVFVDHVRAAACRWMRRKHSSQQLPTAFSVAAQCDSFESSSSSSFVVVTPEQQDEYEKQHLADLVDRLTGDTMTAQRASQLHEELRWLRDSVTSANAASVFIEGCPVEVWQPVVDFMTVTPGLIRVQVPARRVRRGLAKLGKLVVPENNSTNKNNECCWCLRGDRALFFARLR